MSFSTFNSITRLNKSGGTLKPPINVYVNGASKETIKYKFTPPSGLTPSSYEANITTDGISYTTISTTSSPLTVTGLAADTSYNGFIYSVLNGKYSTGVPIKGYTMPVGENTVVLSSSFVEAYCPKLGIDAINPSWVINDYTQGINTINRSSIYRFNNYIMNSILYTGGYDTTFNGWSIIKSYNNTFHKNMLSTSMSTTFYIKHTKNNPTNYNKIFYIYIRYTTGGFFQLDFSPYSYNHIISNNPNYAALQVSAYNSAVSSYVDNNYCTQTITSGYSASNISHTFIVISGGLINAYSYVLGTLCYTFASKPALNINYSGFLENYFTTQLGGSYSDDAIYDFRVFDRVLTSNEMLNIAKNN